MPSSARGPWTVYTNGTYHGIDTPEGPIVVFGEDGDEGGVRGRANAHRIVACVNALEGYNPEAVGDVVEAFKRVTVSLIAAVSLLEKGGKIAAASDKMFAQMLLDYKRAIDKSHSAWVALKGD